MSSHPNPGNRTQYITKEASMLTVATAAGEREFGPIKDAFASLPAPRSMADAGRGGGGSGEGSAPSVGTPGQPVPRPSAQYRALNGGGVFRASVPSNWTTLGSKSAIKVVPQNGYGPLKGETVFSHGVEFGVSRASSRDLRTATNAWLDAVVQSNPGLRVAGSQQAIRMSQRSALSTPLVNPSPLGGQELIGLYTTFLVDGSLFYYMTIVPEKDAPAFDEAFQRVGESIRLIDVR
jgi:hypothetical protein